MNLYSTFIINTIFTYGILVTNTEGVMVKVIVSESGLQNGWLI